MWWKTLHSRSQKCPRRYLLKVKLIGCCFEIFAPFPPTLRVFKWNDIRDYGIHILVLFSLSRLWSTEVVQKNWLQVLLQGLKTRKFKHVMRSYVFIQAEQFKEDVPFCLYVFEFTPYMKLVSTLLFWCNLAKHNCKLLIQDEKKCLQRCLSM